MTETTRMTIACTQPRCSTSISLEVVTEHAHGLQGGHIMHALHEASKLLGWKDRRCPKHVPTETTEP